MESTNELSLNEIAKMVFSGEHDTVDELKRDFNLLLNSIGTKENDLRDKMKDMVAYSTTKCNIEGREYILVDTVVDIIENTK